MLYAMCIYIYIYYTILHNAILCCTIWGRFGTTWGSLWGRFGVTLGSLWHRFGWGHFGAGLGDSGGLKGRAAA